MSDVEDTGSKVHRPAQHAGEWNDDGMFGGIGRLAPGVVLLPARALTADHVRPGSAQPGILHRLVCIDRDVMGRCDLRDVKIVAHHVLAGKPFTATTRVDDLATVADI